MSAELAWYEQVGAPTPTSQTRARANDPLHALLNGAQPDPDAAAKREARRLAVIAANQPRRGEPKGIAPTDAWVLADWKLDEKPGGGGEVLTAVRFMDGKAAARVTADLKRPLIGIEPDVCAAWRDFCFGFGFADWPAVLKEASKVEGLQWLYPLWLETQK